MENNAVSNREYPTVTIDGIRHITITGSECACGKGYDYESKAASEDTLIVTSPLRWVQLSDVTCKKCVDKTINKLV